MTQIQASTPLNTTTGINTNSYVDRISLAHKGGYIWIDTQREVFMSLPMFSDLLSAIKEAGDSDTSATIFEIGRRAGMRWAANDDNRKAINEISNPINAYYLVAQLCGLAGYGELRLAPTSDSQEGSPAIRFHLYGSAEVEAHLLGESRPIKCCWLTTGFLSGYMSTVFSRPIYFVEEFCSAEGHHFCQLTNQGLDPLHKIESSPPGLVSHIEDNDALAASKQEESNGQDYSGGLIGKDGGLRYVYDRLKLAAPTMASVLVQGESGVGKELFARELHRLSGRKGAFVALNCGALPDTLAEAELFGVEKGAFSSADRSRPGRFERAHEGTLFLDEIAGLSPAVQVKLLRVLQEGEIERLGGTRTTKVDVRIVSASNVDLSEAVTLGQFRHDLYYRITTIKLLIPPLRGRRQDISSLINYYVRFYSNKYKKCIPIITNELYQALLTYHYPGNVRELASIIESAMILTPEQETLELSSVYSNFPELKVSGISLKPNQSEGPPAHTVDSTKLPLEKIANKLISDKASMSDIQAAMIVAALRETNGNITRASRLIGVSRRQLSYWLNK